MKDLLIKGGKIISPIDNLMYIKKDILIKNGNIDLIEDKINIEDIEILDATDMYISPGFIDIHTHCYKGKSPIGTDADLIGVEKGSTVVFDAGTAGPKNFSDFKENTINKCKTDVYSLLNVSDYGLNSLSELTNIDDINYENIRNVVTNNKNRIKGIKVRASKSVVGEHGIKPIKIAKNIAKELKIPLTVHLGNYPPGVEEVFDLLDKGDIATHVYHGKANGIFDENGNLKKSVREAKERGVLFDVGHGSASFNFNVFKRALNIGLMPDLISTDIYNANMNGVVYSLLNVINKLVCLGISLEYCIEKVTSYPSKLFDIDKEYGKIEKDRKCNLTIFKVYDLEVAFKDSNNNEVKSNKKLELKYTLKSRGDGFELYRNT